MDRYKVLEALALVRSSGCCNMLDTNCIFCFLKSCNEDEVFDYLKQLPTKELYNLLTRDLSKYLKGKHDE
jgi:hypothetical protein